MIYVFLADGFEEVEAITPIDYLRRCDFNVTTVGVKSQVIRSSHNLSVLTDIDDAQITLDDKLEMIVLPGGMPGTLNLEKCDNVQKAIDYCVEHNILIGAICAAPSILGNKGLLNGHEAICFPGFENMLKGAEISDRLVCRSGNFITAKGAGVASQFAFKLIEALTDIQTVMKLEGKLQCK